MTTKGQKMAAEKAYKLSTKRQNDVRDTEQPERCCHLCSQCFKCAVENSQTLSNQQSRACVDAAQILSCCHVEFDIKSQDSPEKRLWRLQDQSQRRPDHLGVGFYAAQY